MCIWRGFITKNTIKELCMCKYWRANHYVNSEALSCPSKGSGRSWLTHYFCAGWRWPVVAVWLNVCCTLCWCLISYCLWTFLPHNNCSQMYSISKFAPLALIQYSKPPPIICLYFDFTFLFSVQGQAGWAGIAEKWGQSSVLYRQLESCSQTRLME